MQSKDLVTLSHFFLSWARDNFLASRQRSFDKVSLRYNKNSNKANVSVSKLSSHHEYAVGTGSILCNTGSRQLCGLKAWSRAQLCLFFKSTYRYSGSDYFPPLCRPRAWWTCRWPPRAATYRPTREAQQQSPATISLYHNSNTSILPRIFGRAVDPALHGSTFVFPPKSRSRRKNCKHKNNKKCKVPVL